MIRPLSMVPIVGKPSKGFIRPVYRGQMYRAATVAPRLASKAVVRVAEDKRQATCGECRFYMAARKLAFGFELEAEKIDPELMLCGHPKCGCWRNQERVEPWKRRICPERKW